MALAKNPPADLPSTETKPLIEEAYISIATGGLKLENPPAKNKSIVLIVKGTCKGINDETMKDGEDKVTHKIVADSIYERGKVPIVDEGKPKGLFDFVSDEKLWELAKDAATERGELIDDVVTAFLRKYVDETNTKHRADAEPEAPATSAPDTKADRSKVERPAFSDDGKKS
ncbi:hypothetical protein [Gordonia soli]|uniref:Uncharacterized protein n=1 Tax=Gordonia soli NBRC 108243 TaxID=1223545 RepID=M0QS45_9ACTN|nr:hypothetical protein [Gordonia soli]GAC70807.1 hypothetical protein GS4_41_00540 [Gordonia soli NBRC 108243]